MSEATSGRVRRHHADHLRHTDADLDAAVDRARAEIADWLSDKSAKALAFPGLDAAEAKARARAYQNAAAKVEAMRARASDAG